jgi:hypothetical protein
MKIKAIARSHTTDIQTAFKTEPPLTQEVLNSAIEHYFGVNYSDTYFEEDGLFIVKRFSIPQEQIKIYEDALTGAENFLKGKDKASEKEKQDILEHRSKQTGLPVE